MEVWQYILRHRYALPLCHLPFPLSGARLRVSRNMRGFDACAKCLFSRSLNVEGADSLVIFVVLVSVIWISSLQKGVFIYSAA